MSWESTVNTRCYKIAQRLTGLGIAIVPTYPGEHRAKFNDWQNQATTLMSKVEGWMNQGYPLVNKATGETYLHVVTPDHNWVCCAKRGGVGCLDIDNYEKCLAMGMPPLPEDVFIVDTPGKGLHVPFVSTPETDALNNNHDVHENDDKENGELIFEFKGHNRAWCGAWQEREKNPGVMYKPRDSKAPLMVGVPADIVAWLLAHSDAPKPNHTPADWNYAEEFDHEDFAAHHNATCDGRDFYDDGGSHFVVVEECPACGNSAGGSTARAAKCKFIFGGRGRGGYKCHYCGIGSREELETALQEKDPDWKPWDEPIYAGTEIDETFIDQSDLQEAPVAPKPFTALFPNAAEVTAAVATAPAKEKCYRQDCNCGMEHAVPTAPVEDLSEDYTAKLLAITLGDPSVEKDFVHYRKRLNECVKVLAGRRDKDKQATHAPQSKTLEQLLAFEWEYRKLPTKTEFGEYILQHAPKAAVEIVGLTEHLPDVAGLTLDFVAPRLINQCQTWQEKALWQKAFGILDKQGCAAGRAHITQGWRDNAVWGEVIQAQRGALQENEDLLIAEFTALLPENQQGIATSFTTPFPTLNAAFGLRSDDRLLAFIASDSNFKTAVLTNCSHHLATEGKSVLFITGEHEADIVEHRLLWMFRKFLGEDVQLSLRNWSDGKGSQEELSKVKDAIRNLASMREMPGFIMVKKCSEFGSDIGQILTFMEQTFDKYQWKALVIDPFEALVADAEYDTKYFASEEIGARLLAEKTSFHGGEGLVILTSFQLHDKSKDAIKKLQGDARAMEEDYDTALRAGSLNMFKWADNKFDRLMGVARVGNFDHLGVITHRRARFGSRFKPFLFNADPATFLLSEAGTAIAAVTPGQPVEPKKTKPRMNTIRIENVSLIKDEGVL